MSAVMNDLLNPVGSRPGRRGTPSADEGGTSESSHRRGAPSTPGFGAGIRRAKARVFCAALADNRYVRKPCLFPIRIALAFLALTLLVGCGDKVKHLTSPLVPARPPRAFRMGFSAIPPKPDFTVLLAALDLWTRRADAAIMHISPPWDTLLKGYPADSAVPVLAEALPDYQPLEGLVPGIAL